MAAEALRDLKRANGERFFYFFQDYWEVACSNEIDIARPALQPAVAQKTSDDVQRLKVLEAAQGRRRGF